ncbi:MAG: thiazolylpeptide-type bacteriocin [Lentilactobacillus diolivorans]|uniref:thiazolylpeptide-type bacteriocin n=1 Tax=Lentilactobacillus diolivorans TaxID=179838 RepID=UPI0039EC49A5
MDMKQKERETDKELIDDEAQDSEKAIDKLFDNVELIEIDEAITLSESAASSGISSCDSCPCCASTSCCSVHIHI